MVPEKLLRSVSPLTAAGAARFAAWARERMLTEARQRIAEYGDLLDRSERRAILDRAHAVIDSGQAVGLALEDPAGVAFLAWLQMLPGNPSMTEAEVAALVPFADWRAVRAVLDHVNAPPAPAPAVPPEPEPEPDPVPATTPADVEAKQVERRKAIFDRICTENDLTPESLDALPVERLRELYATVNPEDAARVNALVLKGRAHEYHMARRRGDAR